MLCERIVATRRGDTEAARTLLEQAAAGSTIKGARFTSAGRGSSLALALLAAGDAETAEWASGVELGPRQPI